ncbi:MAG: DNA translocase FtsK [Planctomycetaceae bacterium]|jgi:S-DNA-T family DNA segregation ATPase FtsK/SpoIIIE|nr:DNA translocase FtsK [Planctomycetaceae bacterium]
MDIKRLKTDLCAVVLLMVVVGLVASLATADAADPPARQVHPANETVNNIAGSTGALAAHGMFTAAGAAAWLIVLALGSLGLRMLQREPVVPYWQWLAGWLLMIAAGCAALHTWAPEFATGFVPGSGGYVGAWFSIWLAGHLTPAGCGVVLGSFVVAGLVLSGESRRLVFLVRVPLAPLLWIGRLGFGDDSGTESSLPPQVVSDVLATDVEMALAESGSTDLSPIGMEGLVEDDGNAEPEAGAVEFASAGHDAPRSPVQVNRPVTTRSERTEVIESIETVSRDEQDEYRLPDVDLLEESEVFPYALLAKKAQVAAITLEQTFREFGLNVRVVEIDTGPVITQFELELEAGLRLSKVSRLADDLAIALRVPSVRVVPSIPGKNTVGIEVPNERRVMVRLRELIESCPREIKEKRLPVFLGKDVSGKPLSIDLSQMPHLLIAGRTGTGKSVCLNSLILSLLMVRRPDEVKMLMIDPKMVELSPYRRIPHLMHPVITDMKKAEAVLAWAVEKMEERYDLLARCGVRHLDRFNVLGREEVLDRLGIEEDELEAEEVPDRMPYIIIVADEMADLMMSAGKDVESHIIRLAQKSRAVGIHLVLATQKPTVDVITGLIKSNLPARISFQVASRTDSRVVLDELGAEKLLGNGDMLYLEPGTSNLNRAQGTFVSDDEVQQVIEFFGEQEPDYSEELAQLAVGGSGLSGENSLSDRDELYEEAITVVIREGRGSVSLLQRCLGIGYGRAARLIDYMAEDGIVGDYNGSQAREVLYTAEEWEVYQRGTSVDEHPSEQLLPVGSDEV